MIKDELIIVFLKRVRLMSTKTIENHNCLYSQFHVAKSHIYYNIFSISHHAMILNIIVKSNKVEYLEYNV